ncbi:MAG: hypothetical protein HXO02_02835 [Prevotella salivae]|jgi:hypothetical protein|uniref:Uncharacterized protein n=3 Tax=Segatella oris TaxID=28135 RepID=D1QNZ9_9BACT|nr:MULTISPECIES: hypothetical protein [Prevotellaceae]MBF1530758.1 hypothetical protein [Segatella salivae]OFP40590.1 hypothetical protein HMPREF2992_00135 [Prevotella sp. HMSC069G02]EFB32969.1 hypothetical protein HMPREF0971_00668 [Segatella oris F0302]EFI49033.1 hypothetical protein HMPREF0665_00773 [Segatella oris C735]OFO83120.1 hypothetical protein HMPREF3018_02940 [Prevotella sp. HMSC077E08]
MTGLYIFIALIAIALLGWAVAELKSRSITFEHSEEEREEAELLYNEQKERDFKEQDLKDLLAHNSTKGYDAI